MQAIFKAFLKKKGLAEGGEQRGERGERARERDKERERERESKRETEKKTKTKKQKNKKTEKKMQVVPQRSQIFFEREKHDAIQLKFDDRDLPNRIGKECKNEGF